MSAHFQVIMKQSVTETTLTTNVRANFFFSFLKNPITCYIYIIESNIYIIYHRVKEYRELEGTHEDQFVQKNQA